MIGELSEKEKQILSKFGYFDSMSKYLHLFHQKGLFPAKVFYNKEKNILLAFEMEFKDQEISAYWTNLNSEKSPVLHLFYTKSLSIYSEFLEKKLELLQTIIN